ALLQVAPNMLQTEPNARDYLTTSVWTGNPSLVECLLTAGTNPNDSVRYPLPLVAAISTLPRNQDERLAVVHLLLRNGARPEYKRQADQQSALEWAEKNDRALYDFFQRWLAGSS